MTNAKPELVTWKRFDLQITEHPYSSSSVRMIETVNGSYALHSEIFALISQLTADRDAFERDLKHVRSMAGKSRGELEATLEAAEKRVKELVGECVGLIRENHGVHDLTASNKLLSERVAVLEGDLLKVTKRRDNWKLRWQKLRRARTALEGK